MRYTTYKRFHAAGIDGNFNIRTGEKLEERDGYLYYEERRVCAVTSENGWEHFRPDTVVAAHRQQMLEALYRYYERTGTAGELEARPGENSYWKNILRTMPTEGLEVLYAAKAG